MLAMSVHKKNVYLYICWKNKVKIFQMMLVGTMTLLTRSVDVVRLAIGDGKPLRALAININMNISINVTLCIGISNGNAASLSSLKITFNVRVNIIFSICIYAYIQLFITQYRFLSVSFLTQHDVHII